MRNENCRSVGMGRRRGDNRTRMCGPHVSAVVRTARSVAVGVPVRAAVRAAVGPVLGASVGVAVGPALRAAMRAAVSASNWSMMIC